MRNIVLLLLISLLGLSLTQNCGPAQCYSGCTDSRVPVDLVFIIDVSGSMSEEIAGVRSGLTKFVSDLLKQNLIPWYNIILYGTPNNEAIVRLNGESDFGKFKTSMDGITVKGGWEPALETIRRACDSATLSNFGLKFRPNSKKILILLTDEDSDPAYIVSNRFQTQPGVNDGHELCPPPTWSQWQSEIDATAKALISKDFASYFLVSMETKTAFRTSQTCLTTRQFGNFSIQSQTSDYKIFDAKQTLSNLIGAGTPDCLQAQLLKAGKTARVFDVYLADNSVLVQNFYQAITWDLSQCNAKCVIYPCSSDNKCMTPVYICGCDGEPYSNKTLDPLSNCCLESERDCSGICFGKSTIDPCGVCVPEGVSISNLCKKDCDQRYYLTQKPPLDVFYTSDNFQPDPAGYLLSNPDLYSNFISPTGNLKNIQSLRDHFHNYGRFEDRITCDFDAKRYSIDHNVAESVAKSSWINSLLSTSLTIKPLAYCISNSRRKITAYSIDQCGGCIISIDRPPYCVLDCINVWRNNSASSYYIDECGKCVGPNVAPNTFKDSCGVCFGNNTAKNQCGECFGSKALDACNIPVCQNSTCALNCLGNSETPPFSVVFDECGFCVPRGKRDPLCIRNCKGIFYVNGTKTDFIVDECGNCISSSLIPPRDPSCKQDCSGKWNGTAYLDVCNHCVDGSDDYTCIIDCNGDYYLYGKEEPRSVIDSCGVCNTKENYNSLYDKCGVCTNTPDYDSAKECTPDCKGIYSLPNDPKSILDLCNECWFPNQTQFVNHRVDDCGVCRASRDDPKWNEDRAKDTVGNLCPCYQPPNLCFDGTVYFLYCFDCPPPSDCPFGGIKDDCGLCPGNSMYGKKDKCNVCCNPDEGVRCDTDLDECGRCFGFGIDKTFNPCRICNSSLCVVDCFGRPNGTAVVNPCDGICGSNTTCSFCGDGVVDQGETCDLGNGKNFRGSGCFNCQVEPSASNTGSKVGGALGGIASVAFVAFAAFAAYKYAQKNGLIGKSGRNLDFNSANQNPLYKSEASVTSNPIYQ